MKRVKNTEFSSLPTLIKDDQIFTHSVDKANLLAEGFAKNSSLPDSNQPLPSVPIVSCNMPDIHIRTREVKKVLENLNINKSSGPDGIPARVLKICCKALARPLRNLFFKSFKSGKFPSCWKIANVQPIPKKGEASNPGNYRPIAICSTLAKVMETIINHKLVLYLENNALLNDRQYGFRKNRSTGDMMSLLSEIWSSGIHKFGESKVVALDISKAFDRVWHPALISKIRCYGVGQTCIQWISDFLCNRSIRVVVDGIASNLYPINAGVPQGSVLSPTLFLIFINDLLSLTSNPIYSFADDSSLCHSYSFKNRPNLSQILHCRARMDDSLNNDLIDIVRWGRLNRVEFNANKTQCCLLSHKRISFLGQGVSMCDVNITQSDTLAVLGISIRSDLRWDDHIFGIAKEAAKCLGFLKRCKKYFTPTDLRTIYITYIRPKMEYNSHLWAGASKSSLSCLDKVQGRAVKLIGDNCVSSTITSLSHRRNVGCVVLFYRYFFGKCSSELRASLPPLQVFGRNTRLAGSSHPYTIATVAHRTVHYRESSFFSRVSRLWNSLPIEVFPNCYDVCKFKNNVNQYFLQHPSAI